MDTTLLTTPQLRDRGWTNSLIKRFLPNADSTKPNPKYRNAGSPMKLYKCDRVEQIEASQLFRDEKKKADARKVAAAKAVETKMSKMRDYLDNLIIEVPLMDNAQLIQAARGNYYSLELPKEVSLSTERICVNFLRHCETKYESELAAVAGKTGARDAYFSIKGMVLDAIAKQYDWLAEECRKQEDRMYEKHRNEEW